MSFIKLEIVESDEQNPEPTDARKKSDKMDGSVFARIIENKSLFSNVSLSIDAALGIRSRRSIFLEQSIGKIC